MLSRAVSKTEPAWSPQSTQGGNYTKETSGAVRAEVKERLMEIAKGGSIATLLQSWSDNLGSKSISRNKTSSESSAPREEGSRGTVLAGEVI